MNKLRCIIFFILSPLFVSTAQNIVNVDNTHYMLRQNKEQTLYKAKGYLINILGSSTNVTKLEADPISSTESGELTTIVYSCDEKNRRGMLFGFFNDVWNKEGVIYSSYAFKNFTYEQTLELVERLDEVINENMEYLKKDQKTNNIYFDYDDITFVIYYDNKIKMRLFWNNFDSEWESLSFGWLKKKLQQRENK